MSRIDDLVDAWEAAHDQGIRISIDELCRDDPDLIDEVRRQIDALLAIATEFGSEDTDRDTARSAAERGTTGGAGDPVEPAFHLLDIGLQRADRLVGGILAGDEIERGVERPVGIGTGSWDFHGAFTFRG